MRFEKGNLFLKKDAKMEQEKAGFFQETAGFFQGPQDQAGLLSDHELNLLSGGVMNNTGNPSDILPGHEKR